MTAKIKHLLVITAATEFIKTKKKKTKKEKIVPAKFTKLPFKVGSTVWAMCGSVYKLSIITEISKLKDIDSRVRAITVSSNNKTYDCKETEVFPTTLIPCMMKDISALKDSRISEVLNAKFDAKALILEAYYGSGENRLAGYYVLPSVEGYFKIIEYKTSYGFNDTAVIWRDDIEIKSLPLISHEPSEILTYLGLEIYKKSTGRKKPDEFVMQEANK